MLVVIVFVAYIPKTQETEAGGLLWIWGQPGTHAKLPQN